MGSVLLAEPLLDAAYGVGTDRRRVAQIILDEFLIAGYPAGIALAAIVNAEAESSLIPNKVGDNGHSVGLFQLNDIGGKIVFSFDRTDPHLNTRAIIAEFERLFGKTGKIGKYEAFQSLGTLMNTGADVKTYAAEFAARVERPDDIPGAMVKRSNLAVQRFGDAAYRAVTGFAYGPKGAIAKAAEDPKLREALARRYWWAALLFVGAVSVVGYHVVRRATR